MGKLDGKIALVTGASRGIGQGIALGFAREGADLALGDILPSDETVKAVTALGRRAQAFICDVAEEDAVRAMVEGAFAAYGRIDILMNVAGIFTQNLVEDLPVADWDRVMAVNIRGTFLTTHFVLPSMLERGSGVIINTASQLGYLGGVEVAHYCASKGAVIAFTKALAREVSNRGVRVNAIAPGPILTDMMASETESWKAAKLKDLPIGRFGEVHEVVPTAVFLASEEASYYVGQTLGPNGGDVML